MPGKCRPSLRAKVLENVKSCNLSHTDKDCIKVVFERFTPKKPTDDRYPWCVCPTCNGSVYLRNVQEHTQNQEATYCEHCGQALVWSDTE